MDLTVEYLLKKYDYVICSISKKYSMDNMRLEWMDLAQECRIRIFNKFDAINNLYKMNKINNLEAFICTLCKNCCYNYLRDIKNQIPEDCISIQDISQEKF
jgi:DNA-directed RNA polymerase specialized sigma24 family protein